MGNSCAKPAKKMHCGMYDYKADFGIRLAEKPIPADAPATCLVPGRVLVRVRAAGVNPVDAKFVAGDKFPEQCMPFWKWKFTGFTAGFDWSGTVVAAPEGCGFEPGDEVFGTNFQYPPYSLRFSGITGTFSTFASVPVNQCCRKPASLSFVEAASLPLVGCTCLQTETPREGSDYRWLRLFGLKSGFFFSC